MVDEFQDSNSRQLALFEALERDDLFVVGDEQQSIYGFRNADVEIFRRRRAQLAPAGRVATLATNFRSRGQILDTINAAFGPRLGEGFVALREGRPHADAPAPLVELLLTEQTGWDAEGEDAIDLGELPRSQRWRHAEARLLAQRVRDLVDAGDARPEDIVVLLRGLGDLPVYETALEDQGLLTMSVGGRGYWGRQVVRDLCAWLAALANPRDEAALYGVLASPLVGVSSDALAHVARAGRGNAWRAIEQAFLERRADAADAADDASRDAAARPPRRPPPAPRGGELGRRLRADDRERLRTFATRFAAERSARATARPRRAAAPRRRRDGVRPARPVARRRGAAAGQRPQAAAPRRGLRARERPRRARPRRSRRGRARGRGARDRCAGRARRRQGGAADVDPRREGPRVRHRRRRGPRAPATVRRRRPARRRRRDRAAARRPRRIQREGARRPSGSSSARASARLARRSACCTSR